MANDPPICATSVETVTGPLLERRKRQRLAARWPVQIWRASEDVINAHTINVSSDGFYCVLSQHLSPGEVFRALLEISGSGGNRESRQIVLCCEIQVLRVESLTDSGTRGVAFRIVNYSVARTSAEIDDSLDKTSTCDGGSVLF
jgi:hypothetical protein